MSATGFFTTMADDTELLIIEGEVTKVFVQSHSLIVPSGSLEAVPSNKILSVGKVITWSGPAIAIGGLLILVLQPSHDFYFLQEKKIIIPI